jgi:hypothetical protein
MAVFSMAGSNPALPTYPLQRSVRLRSSASAYFNRTPAAAGNRKTWTWSGWVKRGTLGTRNIVIQAEAGGNTNAVVEFNSSDQLRFFQQVGGVDNFQLITTQVFRDPSAWYHIVIQLDTTQATSTNRAKLYVNGSQITALATAVYPAQNFDGSFNNNVAQYIGTWLAVPAYFDGYLEEINFIDGQALTPSSFGAYNSYGVWSPAKYTGTYGTNGFYLNFQDNSALTTTANIGIGADSSGNGNYWTSNNISLTAGATYDSMLDVPTNTSPTNANYCVVNPVSAGANGISNANLTVTYAAASIAYQQRCTFTPPSGQWYHEANLASFSVGDAGNNSQTFGWASFTNSATVIVYGWVTDGSVMRLSLSYVINGVQQSRTNIDTVTPISTDVFALAFDINTGTITAYKNGVQRAQITSISNVGDWTPVIVRDGTNNAATWNINFGQRPFSYTPPTGFNRLNTYNLPDSIVPVGAQYMAATLYTGNGTTQTITNTVNGTSFQPDLLWTKARSSTAFHYLQDSVRGVNKALFSNSTDAEFTTTTTTALNNNGFSFNGAESGLNANTITYVGWQWRASNASAVTNTSGSITSQVSANQTAGFSIVTYTGTGANATVGHGLNVAPKMIIMKARSTAGQNWIVYQASMDATPQNYVMGLNLTVAKSLDSTMLNNTAPTSSVWTIGTNTSVNNSGTTYVAYCFAAVPGYSAFGSYTGNGSADGPFVYLGFRPRFVMIKGSSFASNWFVIDTSRDTYNVAPNALRPNLSDVETTGSSTYSIDVLSSGFKLRTSAADSNTNGATFIYACFAENPFKNALAR